MDQIQLLVHLVLLRLVHVSGCSALRRLRMIRRRLQQVARARVHLDETVVEDGSVRLEGLTSLVSRGELNDGRLGLHELGLRRGEEATRTPQMVPNRLK